MPRWLAAEPLVLASASSARQRLLAAAGVPAEACPADVDERGLEAGATAQEPGAVATLLASAKAMAVAQRKPGRLVLGGDQILSLDGRRFAKPPDRGAARAQLRSLAGKSHELHSAVAFVQNATVLARHVSVARLTMRALSDPFIDAYLDAVGEAATTSVGAYQIEGLGVQLFERVEGDYFTILGLPLIEVLDFLRQNQCLQA